MYRSGHSWVCTYDRSSRVIPSFLAAGFYTTTLPPVINIFHYISPVSYTYSGILKATLRTNDTYKCQRGGQSDAGPNQCFIDRVHTGKRSSVSVSYPSTILPLDQPLDNIYPYDMNESSFRTADQETTFKTPHPLLICCKADMFVLRVGSKNFDSMNIIPNRPRPCWFFES